MILNKARKIHVFGKIDNIFCVILGNFTGFFPKKKIQGCLDQETRKRKDLQLALHALACSSRCTFSAQQACCTSRDPLRDEIREVGRWLSLADTQTGRYVRFYSRRRLCARRSSRRTAQDPPSTFQRLRLRCFKYSSRTQLSKQLSP